MPLTRNPETYNLPPSMREKQGGSRRRGSFEKEMQRAGISVDSFLELAKRDPAAARSLGEQLNELMDNGATQEEIAEFFRNQAKGSAAIADIVEGSGDNWKSNLFKIKGSLPKKN